jgi:hypothetical protein
MNSVGPLHGLMNRLARLPSTQVLGYFQSSATADERSAAEHKTLLSFEGFVRS